MRSMGEETREGRWRRWRADLSQDVFGLRSARGSLLFTLPGATTWRLVTRPRLEPGERRLGFPPGS